MSSAKQSSRTGFRPPAHQVWEYQLSRFRMLMGVYFFGLLVFAGVLLALGGCSSMEKGFNTDIGLKTVITHAPKTTDAPPTSTLQKSEAPAL